MITFVPGCVSIQPPGVCCQLMYATDNIEIYCKTKNICVIYIYIYICLYMTCKEKCFRFLGHWVDENLTWQFHLDKMQRKLISANYALSTCKYSVPLRIRKMIYKSLFESHINFGSVVYGSCDPKLLTNIATIQKHPFPVPNIELILTLCSKPIKY